MATPSASPDAASRFQNLLKVVIDRAFAMAMQLTRNRADAEDLLQEAALRAFRAIDSFEPGTNFRAWFNKILLNQYFAQYRTSKRRPALVNLEGDLGDVGKLYLFRQTAATGLHAASDDPARDLMSRLSVEQVAGAIQALPDEYRGVAVLYFLEEMSYREIADALGCQLGTVRSRLHRARERLQQKVWHLALEEGIVHPSPTEVRSDATA